MKTKDGDIVRSFLNGNCYKVKRIVNSMVVLESEGWTHPAPLALLVKLAYYADKKGVIRLTQGEMSEQCGMSRKAITLWLNAIAECGLVERTGHGRYRICEEPFNDPEGLAGLPAAVQRMYTQIRATGGTLSTITT